MEENSALAKNTLDQIPTPQPGAPTITAIIKDSGKVVGYQLSDQSTVEKNQAIQLARQGGIAGVGIAHRGGTEYLKSIPDGDNQNNLSSLPSVTATEANFQF